MGLENLEGEEVLVDVRAAEKRDGEFKYFDKRKKRFIVDKHLNRGGFRLHEKTVEFPEGTDKRPFFADEKHIIIIPAPCETCNSRKLYHDKNEEWFCPFCE